MGGRRVRVLLSTLAELLGLAAVIVGAYLVDWRLAVIVGGLVLVLIGWALDRPAASRDFTVYPGTPDQ